MSQHCTEDELILYHYRDALERGDVRQHLDDCDTCRTAYATLADTLAAIAMPEMPERGEQYGLEVWQRLRHQLPDTNQERWIGSRWFDRDHLLVAAAAALTIAAFLAGRVSSRPAAVAPPTGQAQVRTDGSPRSAGTDISQRILMAVVAEHLDRADRVLTDIMNAQTRRDISAEQGWADDLLTASRLYRQQANEAGEQSVVGVLEELERNLLEIVHSPSQISAAALEQLRRHIDAAALLFKVRVLSDELRQRESLPADRPFPQTSTRITS